MACLIIGDSIGKGVSDIRKDCTAYVQVGISTIGWSKKWIDKIDWVGDTVFISLGSNDVWRNRDNTCDELWKIRNRFIGLRVTWVLPANKEWVREYIEEIAYEYGDVLLQIPELSSDRVHPTTRGYRALAKGF